MIYVLTYSIICPGASNGCINDLFENAFTDIVRAEKEFNDMTMNREYYRKELWVIEPGGKRRMLKEEKFVGA